MPKSERGGSEEEAGRAGLPVGEAAWVMLRLAVCCVDPAEAEGGGPGLGRLAGPESQAFIRELASLGSFAEGRLVCVWGRRYMESRERPRRIQETQ